MSRNSEKNAGVTRRDFLKTSVAASLAATIPLRIPAAATGSDTIRIGVIGCGGRGTGATIDCLTANSGVVVAAMGDLFPDRVESSLGKLRDAFKDRIVVTPETCFTGFDAISKVLSVPGINLVILAAPPHFRPAHLKAAVDAGMHVFMEKPVAVDPVGVRSVIATSARAAQMGLAIVSGTQRRHQARYLELMRRIHDGAIGDIVGGECYWNQGALWVKRQEPGMSDMEWQCRNWLYFTWLSGDHIVEQHVHNIDVINWAFNAMPVKAMGVGGRQVRTAPEFGNIFDHFTVEFEYANGARVLSMCRQIPGCSDRIEERLAGSRGSAFGYGEIRGRKAWKFSGEEINPYVQEHADLVRSIRAGRPLNEGRRIAESTLCAIMGRMSAYTGRAIGWDWALNASKLDLTPAEYRFGNLAVDPVAVPGVTPLV